jgi:long-chain acyl-CoA synthetase
MIEDQVPEILAGLPLRISDVLHPWVDLSPDHPALVESSGTWTYGQLASVVAETRTWLVDSGVRPGDRVMLVCENCRAFIAVFLALAALDAWPVLVNARLSEREINEVRNHSGARRVIYTTSVSPHAMAHAKRHDAVIGDVLNLGPIGVGALNENVEPEPVAEDIAERVAALIYTSGTTGVPKGVMLTHRNLLFVAAVSARIRSLAPHDRLYGILPMSHAVGLSVVLLGTLLSGATLYLAARFDPMTARTVFERDQLTVVLGVPATFAQLLQYAELRGLKSLRFPSLRIISSSGAPLQMATKTATEDLFGLVLHNGYGVTECSPTIAQTRVETPRTDLSVGPVFPGAEVKLVGPDGKPVARGEVGELQVRGPGIMKGYYRAPEETAEAIDAEGWFNTRDLARLDEGNLFIVGRTKDLIVRFGFNVYPAEVEAVLNAHPKVAQSAVVGRSLEADEEIVAFVQLSPSASLTVNELAEHAARSLAPYKRPGRIVFVPTMPITPTGKIAKAELAKLATQAVLP